METKIGIDLDGVLADYQKELVEFVNEKYGKEHKFDSVLRDDVYDILGGNPFLRAYLLACFYFYSDSLSKISPVPGAVSAVKKLRAQGYKLYIVTSRFWGFSRRTNLWLEKHFGKGTFEKVVYSKILSTYSSRFKAKKYGELGVKIAVEDSSRVATDCAKEGIEVLLMNLPWNRGVKAENITRVKDWAEAVRKIEELKDE